MEIRKKNGRERASVTGPGVSEFAHRTQLLLASVVQFVKWRVLPISARIPA